VFWLFGGAVLYGVALLWDYCYAYFQEHVWKNPPYGLTTTQLTIIAIALSVLLTIAGIVWSQRH
jgi:hypothetical protein